MKRMSIEMTWKISNKYRYQWLLQISCDEMPGEGKEAQSLLLFLEHLQLLFRLLVPIADYIVSEGPYKSARELVESLECLVMFPRATVVSRSNNVPGRPPPS